MTKAPKSLPLCLPRNSAARPAPGRGACVNTPRRGGGVATYEKQVKNKKHRCNLWWSPQAKVSARKGECLGIISFGVTSSCPQTATEVRASFDSVSPDTWGRNL